MMIIARRCKRPKRDLRLKSLASSENWENVGFENNVGTGVVLLREFLSFVSWSSIDFFRVNNQGCVTVFYFHES
jgi:hypothetical protein